MIIRTHKRTIIRDRRGFTLLLVIALLAAFLSIALGIINILLGQVIIIGQAGESFGALYAADIGMERTLYRDRDPLQNICGTPVDAFGKSVNCSGKVDLPNGACYTVTVRIGPSALCLGPINRRCIDVVGKDVCGGSERYVERRFDIKYR